MKKKILITGANGQLGRCLQAAISDYPELEGHFMGREHLPINDFLLVDKVIDALKPDVILNTAAYTAVDKAETEIETARSINGYAVGNLAAAAKRNGASFVHISTDYVFDGQATMPYTENHPTDPLNAYGASKLLGEELAVQAYSDSIIIRTSWVYSGYGNNFVKTMCRLMGSRENIGVVSDQWGCPTLAEDLANVLLEISGSPVKGSGIFHYCNFGAINWYQFARAIQELKGFSCKVNAIATTDYPTPAKRPAYSVLSCNRLKEVWGIGQRPWLDALMEALPHIGENS